MSEQPIPGDNSSALKRALFAIRDLTSRLDAVEQRRKDPIAIIGMGCRFPGGANSPESYWKLLLDGVSPVGEIPGHRWDVDAFYDPDPNAPGRMYSRRGCFLDNIDAFDAPFFGITPREAAGMDPQHRLLLEVVWEALENAGLAPAAMAGSRTGVFIGLANSEYLQLGLTDLERVDAYGATGSGSLSFASGRVAHVFGFEGPTMAVDAACASSLVAVHVACQSLRNEECSVAVVGGINLILTPYSGILLSKTKALAPDGRCKTFDAAADGMGRGEGCAAVILKSLSDAVRDGDPVLAVIRGTASRHDGCSSGFTVPNPRAQEDLIRQALANAGVAATDVSYVEAHGTGTALGDPIEIDALAAVYAAGRSGLQKLTIGSVKTNIGHSEAVAGLAGLMKIVLSLQHETIPAHLHLKRLNPSIPWQQLPLHIATEPTPWKRADGRRLAGVSSFGMSGTIAHAVIEEAPRRAWPAEPVSRPAHVLTLSAKTESALKHLAARFEEHLGAHPEQEFSDVCFTANTGRSHFLHRAAVVGSTAAEVRESLRSIAAGKPAGVAHVAVRANRPKVAFVFSGHATDFAAGRELFAANAVFRSALQECTLKGQPISEIVYAEAGKTGLEPPFREAALLAVEYALAAVWRSWGIEPDAVIGYGTGHQAAACAAGRLPLADALSRAQSRAGDVAQGAALADELAAGIEELAKQGCEIFVEVGPAPLPQAVRGKIAAKGSWVCSLRRGTGDWRQMLQSAAQLYLQGVDVNWAGVDRGFHYARVALPTYPFEHQHYWIGGKPEMPKHSEEGVSQGLLGRRLRSPLINDTVYEAEWSPTAPAFMTDHRVYGTVAVAATTFVETALSGARDAWGPGNYSVEDVVIREALLLDEGTTRPVQLILKPHEGQASSFQVFSYREGQEQDAWTLHAFGKIRRQPEAAALDWDGSLEDARARCLREISPDNFYQSLREIGLEYGPSFANVERVWRGGDEAVAMLRFPSVAPGGESFTFHPGLLDSCFQVAGAASDEVFRKDGDAWMTVGFDSLRIGGNIDAGVWCHGSLRTMEGGAALEARMRIYGQSGQKLAEVRGACFKRVPANSFSRMADRQRATSGWFYSVGWQPKPDTQEKPFARASDKWLILADRRGAGFELGNLLEQQGSNCSVIFHHASVEDERKSVLEFLNSNPTAFCCIVHMRSMDASFSEKASAAELGAGQIDNCAGLLRLVQTVAENRATNPPRLWVVTERGQSVHNAERVAPTQSAAWGLNRVVALEHPELRSISVDLDEGEPAQQAKDLFRVLSAEDDEPQVAIRGGVTHVARLVPEAVKDSVPLVLTAAGTYLISGGLGGLGLAVARWMIDRGARSLVLMGRSKPSDAGKEAIREMEAAGARVSVKQGDVSRQEDVRRILDEIARSLPPLCGIVHAAGVLDDGVLLQQTRERFAEVLAPKVQGTWNLHSLTRNTPLDFFVLFSSAASVLGSSGQGNYTAANAFLDGFAHYRRSLGLPALSINWGPWKGAGMAAEADSATENRWRAIGVASLSREQGVEALEKLLSHDAAQVMAVPVKWQQYAQHLPARAAAFLSEVTRGSRAPAGPGRDAGSKPELMRLLEEKPQSDPRLVVLDFVRTQVARVMGLEAGQAVSETQPLSELGLDSLMAVELKNALGAGVDRALSAAMLFFYPTIQALANYLCTDVLKLPPLEADLPGEPEAAETNLLDAIELLSDDELDERLAELADQHLKGRGE